VESSHHRALGRAGVVGDAASPRTCSHPMARLGRPIRLFGVLHVADPLAVSHFDLLADPRMSKLGSRCERQQDA
jgi:hypothetical protein